MKMLCRGIALAVICIILPILWFVLWLILVWCR